MNTFDNPMLPLSAFVVSINGKKVTRMFRITNIYSGIILGEYVAEDEQSALDAMAREAGYRDYAHAQQIAPSHAGEFAVTRI